MEPTLAIGRAAPDFTLKDLHGVDHSLSDFRGKLAVLNFWSAECPWSERTDGELLPLWQSWGPRVAWLTIACNPNEPLELIARAAAQRSLPLLLLDPRQAAADPFGARTTPHLFVVDAGGVLRYQGAFDDITFRRRTATRHYLQCAVEDLLAGRLPETPETPPYGCTIVRAYP